MDLFEKNYFVKSIFSNYRNYNLHKKYKMLALEIKMILGLEKNDIVLDYGCATGLLIKQLLQHVKLCYGTDISSWAIEYGWKKNGLKGHIFHYNKDFLSMPVNYILMLDVLEHCTEEELKDILNRCINNKKLSKIVLRVPISDKEGNDFVLEVSKNDKTHIQCHSRKWWIKLFNKYGFELDEFICDAPLYVGAKPTIYNSEGVLACVMRKK